MFIHYPGNEKRRTQSGICHIHEPGEISENFADQRILWSKYAEREFEYEGHTFCVVDERDVLAVFEGDSEMDKSELKTKVEEIINEVVGGNTEASANDIQAISDQIEELADTEGEVEDPDDEKDE